MLQSETWSLSGGFTTGSRGKVPGKTCEKRINNNNNNNNINDKNNNVRNKFLDSYIITGHGLLEFFFAETSTAALLSVHSRTSVALKSGEEILLYLRGKVLESNCKPPESKSWVVTATLTFCVSWRENCLKLIIRTLRWLRDEKRM
jgi:hypothetical protein